MLKFKFNPAEWTIDIVENDERNWRKYKDMVGATQFFTSDKKQTLIISLIAMKSGYYSVAAVYSKLDIPIQVSSIIEKDATKAINEAVWKVYHG